MDQQKDAWARQGTLVVPEGVVAASAEACRVSEGWRGLVSACPVAGGQGQSVEVGIDGRVVTEVVVAVGSDGAEGDAAKAGVGSVGEALVVGQVAWDPRSCGVEVAAENVASAVASAVGQDVWARQVSWGQGQGQGQALAVVVVDSSPSDQES